MIRTIELQIEAPGGAGGAAMAREGALAGNGAGLEHRVTVAVPPNVGES